MLSCPVSACGWFGPLVLCFPFVVGLFIGSPFSHLANYLFSLYSSVLTNAC